PRRRRPRAGPGNQAPEMARAPSSMCRRASAGRARSHVHNRDDADPAGARAPCLYREAGHPKAMLDGDLIEGHEPLDLAISSLPAEHMRWPEDSLSPVLRSASSIRANGGSKPKLSTPITLTPRSTSHAVASRLTPRKSVR